MDDFPLPESEEVLQGRQELESEEGTVETLTVTAAHEGDRLDRYLTETSAEGLTRAAAVRLLETGCVTLTRGEGKGQRTLPPQKQCRLKAGDRILLRHPEAEDYDLCPEDIPLDTVYEDDDIIVINKPVGMVVHPAPGNPRGTLVNALLYHCGQSLSGIGGVKRPGIVHRIDKDTSGLLVVAKNDEAHRVLSEQLKTHSVRRVYHAVCLGNLREDRGTLTFPVGRNPNDRKKMAAFPTGTPTGDKGGAIREAVTHFTVVERFATGGRWGQSFTYIQCELETGRTHQIRVHLAATGHPLLGDPLYGGEGTRFGRAVSPLLHGQMLHAKELRLLHPRTGEELWFSCELPLDFKAIVERLRKEQDHV